MNYVRLARRTAAILVVTGSLSGQSPRRTAPAWLSRRAKPGVLVVPLEVPGQACVQELGVDVLATHIGVAEVATVLVLPAGADFDALPANTPTSQVTRVKLTKC